MENITSIEQFKTQYNQVVGAFKGVPNVGSKIADMETLQRHFTTLASSVIDFVPASPARTVALYGLLSQAYSLVGATIGVWPRSAAA